MDEEIKKAWEKAVLCGDCQHAEPSLSCDCAFRCNNAISPCRNRITFYDFGCTYGKPKVTP